MLSVLYADKCCSNAKNSKTLPATLIRNTLFFMYDLIWISLTMGFGGLAKDKQIYFGDQ